MPWYWRVASWRMEELCDVVSSASRRPWNVCSSLVAMEEISRMETSQLFVGISNMFFFSTPKITLSKEGFHKTFSQKHQKTTDTESILYIFIFFKQKKKNQKCQPKADRCGIISPASDLPVVWRHFCSAKLSRTGSDAEGPELQPKDLVAGSDHGRCGGFTVFSLRFQVDDFSQIMIC